jgi:hypothetical protein
MKPPRAKIRLSAAQELENVVVVNRHNYTGPQDSTYFYIGRGTPLGNQWSNKPNTAALYRVETPQQAISKYNDWFVDQIDKGEGPVFNALQQLKALAARGEQLKLACSCTPELCHGDVVKATVELLIHNDRFPEQHLQREPLQIIAPQVIERANAPHLSGRAQQAHTEIDTRTILDDLASLYNVSEGTSRAEHASRLNTIDQFTRTNFERGATLNDEVLSIPKDPDGHEQDEKVIIGTEAHAINFVRGFIADPATATEKGHSLYKLGTKACGLWTEPNGRLEIFRHIYREIRQDSSGNYRSGEQKAQVIDQVLEETSRWALPLPEPTAEPTPEELHQFTTALAEQNRDFLNQQLLNNLTTEKSGILQTSPYFDHLRTVSYGMDGNGLASLGELAGFASIEYDLGTPDHSQDENYLYAEMYEMAISDAPEAEMDHFGVDYETLSTVTFEATFDRISLAQLPPQIPHSVQTPDQLLTDVLPVIDIQIENGVSKADILEPLYESNRVADQRDFQNNVANTFIRAGELPSDASVSRAEELNAISSLRILVATEYREQTKPFSREAIQWARENYLVNADRERAQGKLKQGEYQKIVTAQNEGRSTWLTNHPGQAAPTRAEIASINRLEQSGQQLNAAIARINPTAHEYAQALNKLQSHLSCATQKAESLLQTYEAAGRGADLLDRVATRYAENTRLTPEFQQHKEAIAAEAKENSIDERQLLIRANNPRYSTSLDPLASFQRSNYPELTGEPRSPSPYAQLSHDNRLVERDALQALATTLINPEIEAAQTLNNAELAQCSERCHELTGIKAVSASQARETISLKLQGFEKTAAVVDVTRTRFNLHDQPKDLINVSPAPAYLSLTSNSNIRVPVASLREHEVMLATASQCRIDTSTWSSLYAPTPITGLDQERTDTTRFISSYIDYRLNDHATLQLATNPTFRGYSERLAAARSPEGLIKAGNDIRLENYQLNQQLIAHRAEPDKVAAPEKQPLRVMEMRELFLTTTPIANTRGEREQMKEILQSMTVFGKEKTERVKLLSEGKLAPTPALSKLLTNLDTRQTPRAVDHFYSSLKTPADALQTKNSFDIKSTYEGLQQFEKDYLYQVALACRYEIVNAKAQGTMLTPVPGNQPTTTNIQLVPAQTPTPIPSTTDVYREYYGRADWLEAKSVVEAAAMVQIDAAANLERSTIVPELKDIEVHAINYVVNAFDQNRQTQISDHLKNSADPSQQAIGEMIRTASEVKLAGLDPSTQHVELNIPTDYTLSPDSVSTVINYTQQEGARATEAAKLPSSQLNALRQEAQAQAWRDLSQEVVKDPASLLNAPAETAYQAQDLLHGISHTAGLQERARTAYQIVNTHTATCIAKAEKAVAEAQAKSDPFRSTQAQETTRDLVKLALNPELHQSKAELIKANGFEYALIQQTLTANDKEKAAQLKDYAAAARTEYLQSFIKLDNNRQTLRDLETRSLSETRVDGVHTETTADRYLSARDEIARANLGETVQTMIENKSLPDIAPEQLATLTVQDLLPTDVRELALELAREPAWQSLEPEELRQEGAAPTSLITVADEVMDRVADAQTIEIELEEKKSNLKTFLVQQVEKVERPIQEQLATVAYEERFSETLTTIANDKESPDRAEAANQLLETLAHGELDPATLVSLASTQELDSVPADVVIEADAAATTHAEEVRSLPIFDAAERETIQEKVIAELTGPSAERYNELRANISEAEDRFHTSLENVDEKLTELDLARAELAKENTLQQFREIAHPAAVEINNYFKETVRDEGLPALLDPERFEQHVEQIARVITETAQTNGITLTTTQQSQQQINQVAAELFKTLGPQLEHANTQLAITQELTAQLETTTHLTDHVLARITATQQVGANGDHSSNVTCMRQDRDREREREQQGRQPSSPTTKIQDQSSREPSAQSAAKAPELSPATSPTAAIGNGPEIGAGLEEAAALVLV